MTKKKLKAQQDLYHTVNKIIGTRKQILCPECDSDEYFMMEERVKVYKVFDDDHEILIDEDFIDRRWTCDDCGYES